MALPTRVQRGQIDPFEAAQREFDSMLNRFFGGRELPAMGGAYLAAFPVDVREDQDHIYVDAELPGFRKEDVDITLEHQTLTITAEKKQERKEGEEKRGFLLHERRAERFQRSFTLPDSVDENSVQAKLQDGVLTITLNKREEVKPRKVQVS
jgi:HSP20 family protein